MWNYNNNFPKPTQEMIDLTFGVVYLVSEPFVISWKDFFRDKTSTDVVRNICIKGEEECFFVLDLRFKIIQTVNANCFKADEWIVVSETVIAWTELPKIELM